MKLEKTKTSIRLIAAVTCLAFFAGCATAKVATATPSFSRPMPSSQWLSRWARCLSSIAYGSQSERLVVRAHGLGQVTFEHIRRELNKDADRLANLAMDEAAAEERHV